MSQYCLSVDNISKKFCRDLKRSLKYGAIDLLRELTLRDKPREHLRKDEFWALDDISFKLERGKALGIIGHNGSGKSTMLKLINGLIKPDRGRIAIHGTVGALIELGTGFSPILTGRENIYVNAAILGFSKREIDKKLEEIVDFAEIGDFIDAPVKIYSSGMKVRLGFSVAANLNPDLLLIDEVLSVGDSSFRQRCLDRLHYYRANGGAVIFVSHNSVAVEAMCDDVLLLEHGRQAEYGNPADVIENYETQMMWLSRKASDRFHASRGEITSDDIRFTSCRLTDLDGNPQTEFNFGEPMAVDFEYEMDKELRNPHFIVAVQKGPRQSDFLSMMVTLWDGLDLQGLRRKGNGRCVIEAPPYSPGPYQVYLGVLANATSGLGDKWYSPPREYAQFIIHAGDLRSRLPNVHSGHIVSRLPPIILDHAWTINGDSCK